MAKTRFTFDDRPEGVMLELRHRSVLRAETSIPLSEWNKAAPNEALAMVGRIFDWLDDDDDTAQRVGDGILLRHDVVSSLSERQASAIGLPPATPFELKLEAREIFLYPDFRITASWRDKGDRYLPTERIGAILHTHGTSYRIPEQLFAVVEQVDSFNAQELPDVNARCEALARLQELLPVDITSQLRTAGTMKAVRVAHAAAFSLSLHQASDGVQFDPVLFGRRVAERSGQAQEDEQPVGEADSLLSSGHQREFARRFRDWDEAREMYPVANGMYVYVDKALRPALAAVRKAQQGSPSERWEFARSPRACLEQLAEADGDDESLGQLFIETEQYSQRVIDIGLWSPPVFPWISQEFLNDWLPERYGIRIGDKYVQLDDESFVELRNKVETAIERGEATVTFDGQTIPATPETLESIQSIAKYAEQGKDESEGPPEDSDGPNRTILKVNQNFDSVEYQAVQRGRELRSDMRDPLGLKSTLKKHQEQGFAWLRSAWELGYPGVLLADDMGLGKTFQALAFLRWLKEVSIERLPVLIVAPTGLLANWEEEHDRHLDGDGLGRPAAVYGQGLRRFRVQGRSGSDLRRGAAGLDHQLIANADWVLTSYETLRDYQLSFGPVRFRCVIYDELQKAKNPGSLVSQAVRTVNADFSIGMTGTPIENRMEDLWAVMDVLSPGFLGDLQTFSYEYGPDWDESIRNQRLRELRDKLLEPKEGEPARILRRMKADHLDDLPEKLEHAFPREMPETQAQEYSRRIQLHKAGKGKGMLQLLHLLRGISLHPHGPEDVDPADADSFKEQSARLVSLFDILDELHGKGEKALIFLEDLDMQFLLAMMIQQRYQLARKPLQINGTVPGARRQEAVRKFQSSALTFDVMILSPRAGGVGLTLTAANHVIHLSRWWNPAVEDQCTDRVFRIGQEREVHVYLPLAKHPEIGESSFDYVLDRLLKRKRELSTKMLIPPVDERADLSEMGSVVQGAERDS